MNWSTKAVERKNKTTTNRTLQQHITEKQKPQRKSRKTTFEESRFTVLIALWSTLLFKPEPQKPNSTFNSSALQEMRAIRERRAEELGSKRGRLVAVREGRLRGGEIERKGSWSLRLFGPTEIVSEDWTGALFCFFLLGYRRGSS